MSCLIEPDKLWELYDVSKEHYERYREKVFGGGYHYVDIRLVTFYQEFEDWFTRMKQAPVKYVDLNDTKWRIYAAAYETKEKAKNQS